jgi:hypothetical protein
MTEIISFQDRLTGAQLGPLSSQHCHRSSHADGIFRDICNFDGFSPSPELLKFVMDEGIGLNLLHSHGHKYTDLVYYDDFKRSRPYDESFVSGHAFCRPCSWYLGEDGKLVPYEWTVTSSDSVDMTALKILSAMPRISAIIQALEAQHQVRFGVTARVIHESMCEWDNPDVEGGHIFEKHVVNSDAQDADGSVTIPTTFGCGPTGPNVEGVFECKCHVTSHYCRWWGNANGGQHIRNSRHTRTNDTHAEL